MVHQMVSAMGKNKAEEELDLRTVLNRLTKEGLTEKLTFEYLEYLSHLLPLTNTPFFFFVSFIYELSTFFLFLVLFWRSLD